MKIIGYPEPPTEFSELDAGAVFMFQSEAAYMKVDENAYFNAVNLETGEATKFSCDQLVQPAKDATCMVTW